MAADPQGKLVTIRYEGGSVRAPLANIEALLGETPTSWGSIRLGGAGGFRRPYGYRRRANAAGGKPVTVVFKTGEEFTYRVSGTMKRFIDKMLATSGGDNIANIVTQRGAEFGPEPDPVVP